MITPLEAVRRFVRQQALEGVESYLDDIGKRTKKAVENEVERSLRLAVGRWMLLADSNAVCPVGAEKPVILLDCHFERPTEFAGYIDATNYSPVDSCEIRVYNDLRGDEEEQLSPLYAHDYSGPAEDYLALHPQTVIGRVKVTYRQTIGTPRPVFYRFFGK